MTSTEPRPDTRPDTVPAPDPVALLEAALRDCGETLASRQGLRDQIAFLQETLRGVLAADGSDETLAESGRGAAFGGPRLLDLAELEAVRDDLVGRVGRVRDVARRRADERAAARDLLDRMYADPDAHRGVRVTSDDLGQPGCCRWQVRPVLGLVGRLAGWWRVRVSSGCP